MRNAVLMFAGAKCCFGDDARGQFVIGRVGEIVRDGLQHVRRTSQAEPARPSCTVHHQESKDEDHVLKKDQSPATSG
jgi:hypothetical protein